jgi:hypothetical protein
MTRYENDVSTLTKSSMPRTKIITRQGRKEKHSRSGSKISKSSSRSNSPNLKQLASTALSAYGKVSLDAIERGSFKTRKTTIKVNSLKHAKKIMESPRKVRESRLSKAEDYQPTAVRISYRNFENEEEVLDEKILKIRNAGMGDQLKYKMMKMMEEKKKLV